MRALHRLAPAPLLLLALLAALPCRADDGVEETWDRLHMAGAYVGWVRSTTTHVGGDEPRVETTVGTEMTMKRMGQTTAISVNGTTRETPDGALVRIEQTSRMSSQETRAVYAFSAGRVSIETTTMGNTRTVEKEVPDGLVGPHRANVLARPLAGTTGKVVEFDTFLADFQSVTRVTLTSRGVEEVALHDGTKAPLTRVETKLALAGGNPLPLSPVSWLDAEGRTVKTSVNAGGMLIETFRVAGEEEAKAEAGKPEKTPDVFAASVIQEDGFLPVPRRLEEATIVVRKRGDAATLPDFAAAGVAATKQEDGSLLVRIARRVPPVGARGTRPLADAPADLADALGSSSMIQADAPEIAAVVKTVVGAEPDPWKAAQALERWVHDSVTEKNMNVAFASALEVCRTREGDCTEHAVLLAALCRAAGIPARVLMGVEYVLGIWGGHAWNEVWVAGEWYPLDATNGLGFADPLHLPLARMTMKEGGAAEFAMLVGGLGSIDVDVIEVVRDGRRIAVDDPALVAADGGAWRNRVLGIAFRAPEGWTLDPPGKRAGMQLTVMEVDGRTAAGKTVEIEVRALDTPADGDVAKLLAPFGFDARADAERKVDGRPAVVGRRERDGGRVEHLVAAEADGHVWVFVLDRAGGEPERAAFDAFLATVDFDLR